MVQVPCIVLKTIIEQIFIPSQKLITTADVYVKSIACLRTSKEIFEIHRINHE